MLVFCNYILNVNDIHTENLIANGEYPVVVDAETVLDNKRDKKKKSGREKNFTIRYMNQCCILEYCLFINTLKMEKV